MNAHGQISRHRAICPLRQGLQGDALGHRRGRDQGPRASTSAGSTCPTGCLWLRNSPRSPTAEKRFASQIQGRTYANVFGLVERFITAKLLEIGRDHWLGDQNALEALVRFSDEELKHQALFRRIEAMMGATMPAGYRFDVDPDAVARAVLGKSTWAVLVLTLHIELFVQNHYRQSIEPDGELSELFKDVFLFHWRTSASTSCSTSWN